jgi:hypothetical protein
MKLFLFILLASFAMAQDRAWDVSVGAFAASAAVDAHSSWGRYELNPIVGTGQFGSRQAATTLSISASIIAAEYLLLRKYPRLARRMTWTNFAMAGIRFGTAARNYRLSGGIQ